MKRPVVLALIAVLVAVAVYLLVIRDDADGAKASGDASSEQASRPDRQEAPLRGPGPMRQTPHRGAAPDDQAEPTRDDPGMISRDHRTNPQGEFIRPALPHRSQSPIDGRVTAAVAREVRPIVAQCLGSVPDTAYGERASVMTSAVISIDDAGNLTVSELGPALRDIDEAAAASALECIRAAAPGVRAHVDHAAVESTTVAVTVRPRANRP